MYNRIAFAMFILAITLPAAAVDSQPAAASAPSRANLLFQDFPSRFADGNCLQGLPPPEILEGAAKPAFCKSAKPLLFDMHHTPMPTKLLLDESAGPGSGYDTLYVDFQDDGDFTNNPVYKAVPFHGTMFPDAAPVVLYFRDVHLPRNHKQGTSAHVQIYIEQLPGWPEDITALHPRIIPQRWAVGSVTLGDKHVPAALIDRNWDETFVDKRGLNLQEYRQVFPRGDYLLLGLDRESQLQPCDLDASKGSARLVLNEYVSLDAQVYQVRTAKLPDGVWLDLVPVELPMGTQRFPLQLRIPQLLLIGTRISGIVHKPTREVRLPADTYISPQMGEALLVIRPAPHDQAKPVAATRSAASAPSSENH